MQPSHPTEMIGRAKDVAMHTAGAYAKPPKDYGHQTVPGRNLTCLARHD